MIKRISRTAFYLGLLAVIALSVIPQDAMPPTGLWDKAGHTLAYAALAAAGGVGYPGLRNLAFMAAGLLLLGTALELMQLVLPGRIGSLNDVVANAVGVVLGSFLARGFGALWPERRRIRR